MGQIRKCQTCQQPATHRARDGRSWFYLCTWCARKASMQMMVPPELIPPEE